MKRYIMYDCKIERLLKVWAERFFNSPVANRICWGGLIICGIYIAVFVLRAVLKHL